MVIPAQSTTLWDEALHCFGTAAIFEERAKIFNRRLTLQSYLGLAFPLSVGALYGVFGQHSRITSTVQFIGAVLGILLILVSLWSLTAKWQERFAYPLESKAANYELSRDFKELAPLASQLTNAQKSELKLLKERSKHRSAEDQKQHISDAEKRFGMRAALRQFQRECATCGKVPTSLDATDCDTCGNFRSWRF